MHIYVKLEVNLICRSDRNQHYGRATHNQRAGYKQSLNVSNSEALDPITHTSHCWHVSTCCITVEESWWSRVAACGSGNALMVLASLLCLLVPCLDVQVLVVAETSVASSL